MSANEEPPVDLFGLVGTRLENKYDVEAAVAEGGFGIVYRARHITLRKQVAIKVLKPPSGLSESAHAAFLEGFVREAQTAAQLDHPAIVRVLDFGSSMMPSGATAAWMVLDWLTGETLQHVQDARRGAGGRSPDEALAILRPVFEALAYAHEQGVAHRDIKPANVMLLGGASTQPRQHGKPAVRLLDFGIAKLMAPDEASASGMTHTRAGFLTFSLPYASPEQVSATRTGPWTDVHALALMMTELLTDRAPYPGEDAVSIHMQILSPYRPTPARFGLDVGPWEPVLARALSTMPPDRYQNAGEFLAALEASVPAGVRRMSDSSAAAFAPTASAADVSHSTLRPTSMLTAPPVAPSASSSRAGRWVALAALAVIVPVGLVGARLWPRDEPARAMPPHAVVAPAIAHPAPVVMPAAPSVTAPVALPVIAHAPAAVDAGVAPPPAVARAHAASSRHHRDHGAARMEFPSQHAAPLNAADIQ